jgi:Na+-transporting NADH:ubiquinone oxidoreductase subunit NqrC
MIETGKKLFRTKKRHTLSEMIKRSIISLLAALTIINFALIVLYLSLNSENSQKGYTLKNFQEQNEFLQNQKKILQSQLIEIQKIDNDQLKNQVQKMTEASADAFQFLD